MALIANPKCYPVSDWLDFGQSCKKWGVLDDRLNQAMVDQIFIAVNFEEVDLDANDDKSLCRYEFMEIIVRMAKCKFHDSGIDSTLAAATERILTEYVLPNACATMECQAFRDKEVWDLDIDDLLKANREGLAQVYRHFRNTGKSKGLLEMEDACRLVRQLGYSGFEFCKIACLAYSLSKQLIINEMDDFLLYNDLKLFEFYEFLIRLAHLLFSADDYGRGYPLIKKLQQLLQALLQTITNTNLLLPELDMDVESDSDYEDDMIEAIVQETF